VFIIVNILLSLLAIVLIIVPFIVIVLVIIYRPGREKFTSLDESFLKFTKPFKIGRFFYMLVVYPIVWIFISTCWATSVLIIYKIFH
jgi:hypothetical protein